MNLRSRDRVVGNAELAEMLCVESIDLRAAHRRHLACEEASGSHEMACDLYVSALQRLGLEDERFSTSTSDLNEHLT